MSQIRSVAKIISILRRIGAIEDGQFDAKSEPYRLSSGDPAKEELAKDVSALANSLGGIVAIGFTTGRDPMSAVRLLSGAGH